MRLLRRIPGSLVLSGTMLVAGAAIATLLRSGGAPPAARPPEKQAAADAARGATGRRPEEIPARSPPAGASAPASVAAGGAPGTFDLDRIRAALDLSYAAVEDGRIVQHLSDGSLVELSIDPEAQARIQEIFDRYDVPVGAAVAVDVRTGRVVLFASRSRAPAGLDPCLDATPPAASIFKIVTAAALMEDADVPQDTSVCYDSATAVKHVRARDLDDDRLEGSTGTACATLSEALAKSYNPVFAKLADARLTPRVLLRRAERFVFGRAMPFDLPLDVSPVEVPQDRLEFARTAAGFWHVGMSPVHAAAIAQAVANDGIMLQPTLIDRVVAADGTVLFTTEPRPLRSVVRPSTARALRAMMIATVASGTAHKDFIDPQGRPFIKVPVAGKTGSLANPSPFLSYSWFVGFAPAAYDETPPDPSAPAYAVAALVVNEERWRIKATFVAREALRSLLSRGGS